MIGVVFPVYYFGHW